MLDPKNYGDSIMLRLISHMWGVRITVLNAVTLTEVRFRHQEELDQADMVLVYNGKDHYNAAGKEITYKYSTDMSVRLCTLMVRS